MRLNSFGGYGIGPGIGRLANLALSLQISLSANTIPDTATPGTVVGILSVSNGVIVGASPFVIVGNELRVGPNPLTAGDVTVTVDAPGRERSVFTVTVELTQYFMRGFAGGAMRGVETNSFLRAA